MDELESCLFLTSEHAHAVLKRHGNGNGDDGDDNKKAKTHVLVTGGSRGVLRFFAVAYVQF